VKVFPKDQVQKIKPSSSKSKSSGSTWGFLQKVNSRDFSNEIDSNQENTQDRFQYVPATFLPKKNQSKRPPNQISRIEQKRQFERRKGKKGGGEGIQDCSQHTKIKCTKLNPSPFQKPRNNPLNKNYEFMPSSQPRTTSRKSERKEEERGAAALALDLWLN
jgi:hypothetical protein